MTAVTKEQITGDELIKLWDRHILMVWFKYPNCRIKRAIELFFQTHPSVNREEFYTLPRVPGPFIIFTDMRLWVNRTMYPIWEKLICIGEEDVLERVAILKQMRGWTKCCKNFDRANSTDRELRKLRRNNRQNVFSATMTSKNVEAKYGSHRRSNQWNVCK